MDFYSQKRGERVRDEKKSRVGGARGKKKVTLDARIAEALKTAPKIEGYTVKQIAEITETPWPTARWHLELLEARGVVEHLDIGRAKVYSLKKKSKK
jgi:predicted ArsR family transcriptional regulator